MNRRRVVLGGVTRRPLAVAAAVVALVALVAAAPARAGTFRVSQCASLDGGARAYQADLWWSRGSWPSVFCEPGGHGILVNTPNFRLAESEWASTFFALPARMPGSALRSLWLDWRFNTQAPSENPAYLQIYSAGAVVLVARPGEAARTQRDLPAGTRGFEAQIWCSPLNGPGWCRWAGPLMELRGLSVEVEEHGEPSAAVSGPLTAAGEHAGVEPLEVTASDADSGVATVAVSIAGTQVGTARGECRDDRLPPCPQSLRATLDVDTRAVPDGTRRLRLVVTDAAGNARTVDAGTVEIRNQRAPDVPRGPAAPTASGAPSVAAAPSGSAVPALFPANPLAGRGHVANGSHASERARLDAWLEPTGRRHGRQIRRRTATVPPGVRVRIRGRLTTPRGRPIGRATLAAIRREDGGPWKTITGVRTRPNGRFTAFTRIGPSQHVQFVYYAFGDSTTGRRSPRLHVRVRRE